MKHKHHIIPKHMGGSDDPSNLVEVTVVQHAMFHFCNFQLWNKKEDEFAWLGLVGYLPKKELISKLISHNNKVRVLPESHAVNSRKAMIRRWQNSTYRKIHSDKLRKQQVTANLASQTEVARQKQKDSLKAIGHQQGSKNSMFGKMWITNGINSYRIDKVDSIPEGYRKGRVQTKQTPE